MQLKRLKKFEEVEVDATEAIVRERREELQKNITAEEMARSLKTGHCYWSFFCIQYLQHCNYLEMKLALV